MNTILELAAAIKAAHREIERRFNDVMRPLGITAAQAEAILIIGTDGPMALQDLGERLIAESGHPSRLVDRLVAAGHVHRAVPVTNRRRVELSLTPRGRELVPAIIEAREPLLRWGTGALADHDLPAVLTALHAILRDSPLTTVLNHHHATPAAAPDPMIVETSGRAGDQDSPGS